MIPGQIESINESASDMTHLDESSARVDVEVEIGVDAALFPFVL